MAYNFAQLKQNISETQEWLKKELSSIRTGRAAPAILDSITVESYGSRMHINQLAGISVEDPRTIRITPWDATQLKSIEKAINESDLGLSVSVDERGVRVGFPELTSERRAALVKVLKQKLEEARVALRLARERVWEDIQEKEKKGEIAEDDKFRLKTEMQKMVDEANKNLEEQAERKEKDILN